MSQRATFAEVEVCLAQATDFNEAELRSQALAQAADDRRRRLTPLDSGSDLIVCGCSSMYFIF